MEEASGAVHREAEDAGIPEEGKPCHSGADQPDLCGQRKALPEVPGELNLGTFTEGEDVRLKEVRIKPGHKDLVIETVLELQAGTFHLPEEEILRKLSESDDRKYRVAAIDLGVDNLCAVTDNFGEKPFLVGGQIREPVL